MVSCTCYGTVGGASFLRCKVSAEMTLEQEANPISPFAVFRNPEFTKIWFAQLVSTIGDSFTMIAAGIYIYDITGSALQVGLMMMATSIPNRLDFIAAAFAAAESGLVVRDCPPGKLFGDVL